MLCRRSLAAAASLAAALAGTAPLTLLSDPAARCMDGSLGGFYHQPATGADGTKWVFRLEGGGECTTKNACYAQLNTSLGSSKYFPKSHSFDAGSFFLDDNVAQNPLLHSWNHVDVGYCSQDLFSGTRTSPSAETWGIYFSGHLIFSAVLDALDAQLQTATDIVITGDSAGGIGAWMNGAWETPRAAAALRCAVLCCASLTDGDALRSPARTPCSRFRGGPVQECPRHGRHRGRLLLLRLSVHIHQSHVERVRAAWLLQRLRTPLPPGGAPPTPPTPLTRRRPCRLADFRPEAWPKTYALWQAFVDESCAAAMPSTPWACMLSNYSYPYVASESFAAEAQSDQVGEARSRRRGGGP